MSYDIYGNELRFGHCEVHPHIHEEYPCSLCYAENEREQRLKAEYERMHAEYAEQCYREMEADYHVRRAGAYDNEP